MKRKGTLQQRDGKPGSARGKARAPTRASGKSGHGGKARGRAGSGPVAKAAGKALAPPKAATSRPNTDDRGALVEELDEARAQLARIAGEENNARRDLQAQVSRGRTVEESLRRELQAMRIDLRTALADLEISRADHARAEAKLLEALHELRAARESERLAAHATGDMRDRLLDAEQENERLKRELAGAKEEETAPFPRDEGAE